MNNVIIHGPGGNEFNTDAYEYNAVTKQFIFRSPKRDNNWVIFDDVDIQIDVTGFLIEISCQCIN